MESTKERPLLVDKLCSGDRPSLLVAGMAVAHEIKTHGVSVLVQDALGRLVPLPPQCYEIRKLPLIADSDLDQMTEDEAIKVMVKEDRQEAEILSYLGRRGTGL